MNAADEYLLGDSALYGRLCLITELLGQFVAGAPRAVGLAQLEQATGRPARELLRLCKLLCREQLLHPHPGQPRAWTLACETSRLTLEDAFRCAMSEQASRARPARQKNAGTAEADARQQDAVHPEIGMLVMQATMGINQSVFQHLRQFSLDRLRMTAAGMFLSRRSPDDGLRSWPPARLSFS
ncbi:hypothetical protein [Noviherbaspirillum malthae]|jgi:hypothetical protein|uniref:hypothetical protein n=1 Tax=Noviherbaspirillum malthae TaxID=1260987 RepID=UPI00188EA85D|nr:hypothetical protein [Noviherbaspirillum malthae]